MTVREQVLADTKIAMKSGNQTALLVLRGLTAAFNNKAIEKGTKDAAILADADCVAVIATEAKKILGQSCRFLSSRWFKKIYSNWR